MNEKKEYGWKLKEIILVAMICIVFGVVYLGGVYCVLPQHPADSRGTGPFGK